MEEDRGVARDGTLLDEVGILPADRQAVVGDSSDVPLVYDQHEVGQQVERLLADRDGGWSYIALQDVGKTVREDCRPLVQDVAGTGIAFPCRQVVDRAASIDVPFALTGREPVECAGHGLVGLHGIVLEIVDHDHRTPGLVQP